MFEEEEIFFPKKNQEERKNSFVKECLMRRSERQTEIKILKH